MYISSDTEYNEFSTYRSSETTVTIEGNPFGYVTVFAIDESFKNRGFLEFARWSATEKNLLEEYIGCITPLRISGVGNETLFEGVVEFDSSASSIGSKDIMIGEDVLEFYRLGFNYLPGASIENYTIETFSSEAMIEDCILSGDYTYSSREVSPCLITGVVNLHDHPYKDDDEVNKTIEYFRDKILCALSVKEAKCILI
jgi:hypothetical protein